MPKIISAMQAMGYKPDPDGVCFGLAAMSAQATIRKNTPSFVERIALIHNSGDTFPSTIKKEKQMELQSFFDELSIYQGPDNHSEISIIFPELRQDIANLELITPDAELASYSLLKEEEKTQVALPKTRATFVNNFTYNEFADFIEKSATFLNGEPFSLLISELTTNHTAQLGFDGTQWLFANHDEVEICDNVAINVQALMLKFFHIGSCADKKQKTLSISLLLSHLSQTNLSEFDNYDFDLDTVTPEFDKNILFELMLNAQSSKKIVLLKGLIDKIKHIDPTLNLFVQALEFKDSYGQSISFGAIANGQSEILNLLIEALENTDLSEITKANLLNSKDDIGISSFYYAASGGYTNTARILLHAMDKVQLHSQKKDMLSLQDLDGISAIHAAALDGNIELLELLINAINELNISETQKFKLITTKTHKKISALHMAADESHLDIMELLLNTIKQKRVPKRDKLAWITSSASDGRNALNITARIGSVAAAKQLITAIDAYNIDANTQKKYKSDLLSSKSKKGVSAAMTAAKYGHVEFYRYILDTHKQLYGDTTSSTLSLLSQKQIKGKSAIHLAAEYGRTEMINFLIEIVMALNINDSHKALLIEAQRYNGTSALSLAAKQGHSKVVDEILKAIHNMKLSENDKLRLIDTRNKDNVSALLLAVDEGDMATVKVLVGFILSSNLATKTKTTLLTSALPSFNLKSAYQHAINKRHQQMADYFKSAILGSRIFTKKQESTILKTTHQSR